MGEWGIIIIEIHPFVPTIKGAPLWEGREAPLACLVNTRLWRKPTRDQLASTEYKKISPKVPPYSSLGAIVFRPSVCYNHVRTGRFSPGFTVRPRERLGSTKPGLFFALILARFDASIFAPNRAFFSVSALFLRR
jgi:hypothetical protein